MGKVISRVCISGITAKSCKRKGPVSIRPVSRTL